MPGWRLAARGLPGGLRVISWSGRRRGVLCASSVVLALLASCAHPGFPTGDRWRRTGSHATGTAAAPAPDSIVVASYNIRFGERIDEAIGDLRSDRHTAAADLILLQEMDPDGCERVARALGYNFVYFAADVHPSTGRLFGNAILARRAIAASRMVELPTRGLLAGTNRIAVAADVTFGPDTIRIVCTHLSTPRLPRAQRVGQLRVLVDSLAAGTTPMLVGGDFNTTTKEDAVVFGQVMLAAGFRDAPLPGDTARRRSPSSPGDTRTLDHIYSRGLRLRSAGIAAHARASDHLPVWAVLEPVRHEERGYGETIP